MSKLLVNIDYVKMAQWCKHAKWCIKRQQIVDAVDFIDRIERHLDKAVIDGKKIDRKNNR